MGKLLSRKSLSSWYAGLFVYAALACQHLYRRLNAVERQPVLDSVRGEMRMIITEDWNLQNSQASSEAIGQTATRQPMA